MNELDLFRDFCRGVAAPSAEAQRRASARLASALDEVVGREKAARLRHGRRRWPLVAARCSDPGGRASRHAGVRHRRSPPRSDSGRTCAARGAESCVVARRPADRFREQARRQGAVRHERRRQRPEDRGARRGARHSCLVARRAEDRLRRPARRPIRALYVVNADGSGQRTLARRGSAPAWSPDGRSDRVREQQQALRHERRRERAPDSDAAGERAEGVSCVVARRAETRLPRREQSARDEVAANSASTSMS